MAVLSLNLIKTLKALYMYLACRQRPYGSPPTPVWLARMDTPSPHLSGLRRLSSS